MRTKLGSIWTSFRTVPKQIIALHAPKAREWLIEVRMNRIGRLKASIAPSLLFLVDKSRYHLQGRSDLIQASEPCLCGSCEYRVVFRHNGSAMLECYLCRLRRSDPSPTVTDDHSRVLRRAANTQTTSDAYDTLVVGKMKELASSALDKLILDVGYGAALRAARLKAHGCTHLQHVELQPGLLRDSANETNLLSSLIDAPVHGHFSIIHLGHILECAPEPSAIAAACKGRLSPDGTLVLGHYHAGSYFAKRLNWRAFEPELRQWYFDPTSLNTLMKRHRMSHVATYSLSSVIPRTLGIVGDEFVSLFRHASKASS